jgi:hypothetical protein
MTQAAEQVKLRCCRKLPFNSLIRWLAPAAFLILFRELPF